MATTTTTQTTTQTAPEAKAQTDVFIVKTQSEIQKTKDLSDAKQGVQAAKIVRHMQAEMVRLYATLAVEKRPKQYRPIVVASLVEAGVKPKSAETIASRYFTFAKPENEELLKQVEDKEMSVRKAYGEMTKKQNKPAGKSNIAKMEDYLAKAVSCAIGEKLDIEDLKAELNRQWANATAPADAPKS